MNGTKIISANAGDSRAIVVTKTGKTRQITRDHKPDDDDEKVRIGNCGGRIEAFRDHLTGEEMGPKRVWLMNEDVPGLAMSLSLGDYCAQSVGVIPDPEIIEYEVTPEDIYMVIASDGVWEFLSNDKVAEITQ
jgi:serine/threonine protein phosphatase PrpC